MAHTQKALENSQITKKEKRKKRKKSKAFLKVIKVDCNELKKNIFCKRELTIVKMSFSLQLLYKSLQDFYKACQATLKSVWSEKVQ